MAAVQGVLTAMVTGFINGCTVAVVGHTSVAAVVMDDSAGVPVSVMIVMVPDEVSGAG
jgi:hypothetical protein